MMFRAGSSHTRPKLRRSDLIKVNSNLNPDVLRHTKDIETCQKDIELVVDKEKSELFAVVEKYARNLKPLFERRSKIILSLPNFWASVIGYHPKLATLVDDRVVDVLRHVTKVDMEYTGLNRYKFSLHFGSNPYIENDVISKEVFEGPNNHCVSKSTTIFWKNNPFLEESRQVTGRKRNHEEYAFFDWFCNDVCSKDDFNMMLSLDSVWQNPLTIYFMVTGPALDHDEQSILEEGAVNGSDEGDGIIAEEENDDQTNMDEDVSDDSDESSGIAPEGEDTERSDMEEDVRDGSSEDDDSDSISSDSLGSERYSEEEEEENTTDDDEMLG